MIFTTLSGYGQGAKDLLSTADSLFINKKYTESYEVYEQIFINEQAHTPAMLLKMAFIKEGLGDYSKALYFLNVYFQQTLDPKVLNKIQELASEHDLKGYSRPEASFISGVVARYADTVRILVVLVLVFWLLITVLYARKSKKTPLISFILLGIFTIAFVAGNNIQTNTKSGIIAENATYLMDGPSGASNVVYIVEKGHKVRVLEKEGLWAKIEWEGEELYLRQNKLLELI